MHISRHISRHLYDVATALPGVHGDGKVDGSNIEQPFHDLCVQQSHCCRVADPPHQQLIEIATASVLPDPWVVNYAPGVADNV